MAGFSDETLGPFQGANITRGHMHLDAHGLPLSHTLGLVTCFKDISMLQDVHAKSYFIAALHF